MKFFHYLKLLPLSQKVLHLIIAVFGCIFYTTVIGNHYYFRTAAFDYSVYNFAFWDYSHFHINPVPSWYVFQRGPITFIQDHFSLTLMYFIPVYWLLNWITGSYTLLILQVTMTLICSWAIYRLIKLKTNDEWLSVLSVLYYFLLIGHYCSFNSDYHDLTLICCGIPIFLLCFELKKYRIAFVIFILLLFSREDISLWLIFIFIMLIVWNWKEKKIVWYSVSGILISLAYFIVVFKIFIPMCETTGHYSAFQYSALGKNPGEALLHVIKYPIETFKLLYLNPLSDHAFDGVKKEFYLVYLISGGFLLLIRPQYFIWFIPLIAQKMFNDNPIRWSIEGYYCDQIITILPISVFLIISYFKNKRVRYFLAISICLFAFSETYYKMNSNNRVLSWDSTIKENIFNPVFFHPPYNAAKIHSDLNLIPATAKVSASESIIPHLSQRLYAYEFPDIQDAEYIAVFTYKNYYLVDSATYSKVLNQYITSPHWKIIAYHPPFLLIKKV
jgi:uncharacterized membrane protein